MPKPQRQQARCRPYSCTSFQLVAVDSACEGRRRTKLSRIRPESPRSARTHGARWRVWRRPPRAQLVFRYPPAVAALLELPGDVLGANRQPRTTTNHPAGEVGADPSEPAQARCPMSPVVSGGPCLDRTDARKQNAATVLLDRRLRWATTQFLR